MWAHGMAIWTTEQILRRKIIAGVYFKIISPIILANIEIDTGYNLLGANYNESSDGLYERLSNRGKRSTKFIMRRNNVDYWFFEYKDSEEDVSEEIMISIINSLMDNGFDVEVYIKGETLGVRQFILAHLAVEVTRISKN